MMFGSSWHERGRQEPIWRVWWAVTASSRSEQTQEHDIPVLDLRFRFFKIDKPIARHTGLAANGKEQSFLEENFMQKL